MTNGILQNFCPALSDNLSWKTIFGLFNTSSIIVRSLLVFDYSQIQYLCETYITDLNIL